ncbi:MAG: hypothetical protein AABO58_20410 [Acidobacteriota bacterium]
MTRLASAVLVMLIAIPAMAEPPKVDVRFVIEAREFVDGLGKSRSTVERALSVLLLDECRTQKSFPFIQWVNNDAAAPNRLVAALVQRKAGAGVETLIEYRATFKIGSPPPTLQEVVYRWFDAKNADVADAVRPWLEKKIRKQFADAAFRAELLRYFVSQITLADRVDLDNVTRRVFVPVPASQLLADETHSELAVSFFGKSDGRPGAMTLGQPQDYPQAGGVLCLIKTFNFGPVNFGPVPPLTADRSEILPQVFGPTKVRDVRVTMTNYLYKWHADTSGGSLRHD